MIKSVIFDFDGVILDSNFIKEQTFARMYSKYGHKIKNKVINHHINNLGVSRYNKFKIYHEKFLGIKLNNQQINSLSNEFSNIVYKKIIEANFIKGAYEYLSNYYKEIQLHISSATPTFELINICKKRNIYNFFNTINGYPESKIDHINFIIKKFNLDLNELVFIGDSLFDFIAAKKFDIYFVYVGKKIDNDSYKKFYKTKNLNNLSEIIHQINLY